MLNQLSNLGVDERDKLSRNPYLQYAQQPSTKEKFMSGLASGLNRFAEMKMQQMETANKAKGWESLGLRPEVASFISQQSPDFQKDFFNKLEGIELGAPQQAQQPQQVQAQQMMPGEKAAAPSAGVRIAPSKEKQKMAHEEQKMINKEVFPYIKEVQQKAKGAKENNVRLDRMEKLIESGKLNNPQFAGLLKTLKHGIWGVGLDLTGLMSPESQEFDKISADFIKNAKDLFGTRITDTDLKAFLATIPNLSQSNEGKAAVIRNLKLMNKASEVREKAARNLLKKYGTKPPLDFEAEVEEKIKPELDAIASEFATGNVEKPVGTTSLIPDILNAPGKLLLGSK